VGVDEKRKKKSGKAEGERDFGRLG